MHVVHGVVHGVVLGVAHASCACVLCMLVVHAAWPGLYLSVDFLPQGIMLDVNAQMHKHAQIQPLEAASLAWHLALATFTMICLTNAMLYRMQ